jgi:hypothetical protein
MYSDAIGRPLNKKEQVHHIDMNKLNNCLKNFWLCPDINNHHRIHNQAEELALSLLGSFIWFDRKTKTYSTDEIEIEPVVELSLSPPTSVCLSHRGRKYAYWYLGNKVHIAYHRYVAEKILGRKLRKEENVHHIDGDSLNNKCSNLVVLSRKEHTIAHESLQKCVAKLYTMGLVGFQNGKYYVKKTCDN